MEFLRKLFALCWRTFVIACGISREQTFGHKNWPFIRVWCGGVAGFVAKWRIQRQVAPNTTLGEEMQQVDGSIIDQLEGFIGTFLTPAFVRGSVERIYYYCRLTSVCRPTTRILLVGTT